MATKQLGHVGGAIAKRIRSLDFQFDLFRKAGMKTTLAERNQFILTDETKARIERGERFDLMNLGNYKLVVRDNPISIFERDGELASFAALSSVNPSEKTMGKSFSRRTADESRLFVGGNDICSVEMKELI